MPYMFFQYGWKQVLIKRILIGFEAILEKKNTDVANSKISGHISNITLWRWEVWGFHSKKANKIFSLAKKVFFLMQNRWCMILEYYSIPSPLAHRSPILESQRCVGIISSTATRGRLRELVGEFETTCCYFDSVMRQIIFMFKLNK